MGFWGWLVPSAGTDASHVQNSGHHWQRSPSFAATERSLPKLLSSGLHPALRSLFPSSRPERQRQQDSHVHLQLRLKLPSLQAGLQLAPELLPLSHCSLAPLTTTSTPSATACWQASHSSTPCQPGSTSTDSVFPQSAAAFVAVSDASNYDSSNSSSSSSSSHEGSSTGPVAMRGGKPMHAAGAATPPPDTAVGRQRTTQDIMQTVKLLLAGGLAGAISKTATAPLARLTILYQVSHLHCMASTFLVWLLAVSMLMQQAKQCALRLHTTLRCACDCPYCCCILATCRC